MTLNRKSEGQGHRERSQIRRSHQGLFPCKVSSLYWLMQPRTNLNAEVNQNVDRQTDGQTDGQTDRQTDGRTDGHHQSISRNCFAIRPKIQVVPAKAKSDRRGRQTDWPQKRKKLGLYLDLQQPAVSLGSLYKMCCSLRANNDKSQETCSNM